jgi:myo-inositol-1(or 4)-monophosphatase
LRRKKSTPFFCRGDIRRLHPQTVDDLRSRFLPLQQGLAVTITEFHDFVERLADAAGKAVLPFFRTRIGMHNKDGGGGFDPVTEADKAAEAVMRRLITAQFPAHGIIGEEFGDERPGAEYQWVLDPIDGTRAFISGLPVWGTLIGLTRNGVAAYGMMSQPFIGERFHGDGGSAHYRGPGGARRLLTRDCGGLGEATVMTTTPALFTGDERRRYDRVEKAAKLARYGCDCYAYAMLAAGHVDLVIESGLKPYDIVALIPIIEGAGGVVTTWTGEPATGGGQIIAAANPRLHGEALEMLAG